MDRYIRAMAKDANDELDNITAHLTPDQRVEVAEYVSALRGKVGAVMYAAQDYGVGPITAFERFKDKFASYWTAATP